MNPFEGKTPSERNKIIAAGVLGVLALVSLFFAFGRGLFASSAKQTVSATPTPKPAAAATPANPDAFKMPSADEQTFAYTTIPVVYNPATHSAPDAGRNIFAFYEPAPPCPDCPPPTPKPTPIVTPSPTPTPPILLAFVNPQMVYAGQRGFRLEVSGDKFAPDTKIYFSQNELPTQFLSPQRMVADVPASMVAGEGPRQVIIQSTDGKRYSTQMMVNVQPQPKPNFQYIGMVARKRHNNDTAYFMLPGAQSPVSARLSDVVGGRFRLVSISAQETVFEDANLGFRHSVKLTVAPSGSSTSVSPTRGFPGGENYVPYNPNVQQPVQSIPGIPDNIPRYVPPQPANRPPPEKKGDEDDDTDGN
ncbi:MAG TPA: hypothetical protein VJL58_09060 [Pyrinomonadaceae bacterium]|nr:hypothetical protein [Pyrinomonadaceae bacterium]